MPGNVVVLENAKKHYTHKEKEARATAENALQRKTVNLRPPPYVKKSPEAMAYWRRIRKEMKDVELLDNLDADTLGRYCRLAARLDRLNTLSENALIAAAMIQAQTSSDGDEEESGAPSLGTMLEITKRIESTERSLLAYASKLGLTPDSRARLARARAEMAPKDPDDDLYD